MFFHKKDGSAGFYDMQCVAAEHPMRDVAYHLILSCDGADLARNERAYVEAYLKRLAAKGQSLSYEDAWREYRLHALWALTALIISAGASADLLRRAPRGSRSAGGRRRRAGASTRGGRCSRLID